MYENLDQLLDAFDDDTQAVETMAVVDAQNTMMLLAFNEHGDLFYTRVPTEDDSPTGFIRDTEVRWPLRILRPATPHPSHGPGPLGDARRALAAYDEAGFATVLQAVPTLAQSLRALIAAIDIDLAGAIAGANQEAACDDHRPVQHRDGKPPWCKRCGLTSNFQKPERRFGRGDQQDRSSR